MTHFLIQIVVEKLEILHHGNEISIYDYINCLSDAQRDSCHSMVVTLDFDPRDVLLDTASGVYLRALESGNIAYENINGDDYVNHLVLKVGAEESKVVRFYKVHAENNYTYQSGDMTAETSIVTVSFS